MKAVTRTSLLVLTALLFATTAWAQTASVSGVVTDADDGLPLAGANVVLTVPGSSQIAGGSGTDLDGMYTISGLAPGTYSVRARFIGYQETDIPLTLAAGETATLNITISQVGLELNTVVVTASRRAEKVLDAPASISVLSARDVEENVGTSSVEVLRNTTGIDMAQTGVDRREVVLRGFNNAFSGSAYVLTDYRHAAAPSLGVNIYSVMPTLNIDTDRVEVVRGPGSALYGAGVDAGVVHFVSKDPFTSPGTTVSLSGGERSYLGFQARHAGVVGDKLGYKITGQYGQADDWELDPNDEIDAVQINVDGIRNTDFQKRNINGTLEYRPSEGIAVTANAGWSALDAAVLSGVGTVQALGFGYSYGQLRLQANRFFAQVYVNQNNAGDSFVYGAFPVVDHGRVVTAQAQYDLELMNGREQLIIGVDAELTRPDTEGTILGRNEDNDEISEYGLYAQSTTSVTPKFDLTLAARGDYNSISEDFEISPRAAVVFKPTPGHSVRATFNHAFSSPGVNSMFLDIVAGQIPGTDILIRGRGAGRGFTWERNAAFSAIAGTDLVTSSLNPAALGVQGPAGLPLDATYASLYAGISAIPPTALAALLQGAGVPVDAPTAALLVQLLNPQLTQVQGFSRGVLGKLNLSTFDFDFVNDLSDIAPLSQTTTQTFEVGYKGVFNNKVLFAIDAYQTTRENFVGPLALESPFVFVPGLANDLTGALAAGIAGNPTLAGALGQFGITPETAAALIVGLAGDQLPDALTPIAIVQAAENNPGVGQTPELMLSYRNFGKVSFWGVDASTQVLLNDQFQVFANLSIVSDDFFDNEELEETNTDLSIALNAPTLKLKLGANMNMDSGLSANIAGRYNEGFPVRSGPYVGDIEAYFLLDIGAGYDFANSGVNGLRVDLGIQNVLGNEHREFIGAPKLGRMGILRATYTIQ